MSGLSVYENWEARPGGAGGLLRFGAQNPAHPWWVMADTICEALVGYHQPLLPGVRVAIVTPPNLQGAYHNPIEVGAGELTLAITTPSVSARMAKEGKGPYRKAYPGLRAIAAYPHLDYVIFMISAKTGITSLEELVERRYPLKLVTGRRSGGEVDILTFTVEEVLRQYGCSYETIERWGGHVFYGGPTHIGGNLVLQGQAEAIFQEAKHAPIWHQLAGQQPMNYLAVNERAVRHMEETYGYPRAEIPAGTYKAVERPVPTVDFGGWLVFCRDDLPEEWAYAVAQACDSTREQVAQALWDRVPRMRGSVHVPIGTGYMFNQTAIPLHPGAARYAREHGCLGQG